jgi:lipopolysaccharide biosynthesis glycosyltransferase
MNRSDFIKEYSEKQARKLETKAKKRGTEIKDYLMAQDEYDKYMFNTIFSIIYSFAWYFIFFILGMLYTVIKLKNIGIL